MTGIYDNAGINILDIEYFDNILDPDSYGRLESTTNTNGQPTDFGFELDLGGGLKSRSSNTSGTTVEQVVNGRGDVLRTVRLIDSSIADLTKRRYLVTVSRFNLRGLNTHQSKPFYVTGAENRFTQTPNDPETHPEEWASMITYDELGRALTTTDASGATTTMIYDDENGITQTVDPFGASSFRIVDPVTGRLLETYKTDGQSAIRYDYVKFEYNEFGHIERQIQTVPDGAPLVVAESAYDELGFQIWSRDQSGNENHIAYNKNGDATHQWRVVSEPDATEIITVVDVTAYNPDDKVDSTAQYEIRDSVIYDQSNFADLKAKIDQYQFDDDVTRLSQSISYNDESGRQVATRRLATDGNGNETWFVSYRVYDSQGRVSHQIDEHEQGMPADKIFGTQTEYYPTIPPPITPGKSGPARGTGEWSSA